MTERKLVKIVDHCERLTRRQYDYEQGRPVADEEFYDAFNEACMSIWKLTADDVDWDVVPEAAEYGIMERTAKQREYAASRGYSLDGLVPNKLVPCTDDFIDMIRAEEHGAFAMTPEQKAALKLKNEAADFVENKRNGVISGTQ